MLPLTIDLNSDVGESFGAWSIPNDERIIPLVSSANIACGFHAGDPRVMLSTCRLAVEAGARVGAHIGYRDLAGFGRRSIDYDPADLRAETIYQIGALRAAAQAVGTTVSYVKPHGALYNRMAHDSVQAQAVIEGILDLDPSLQLMALAGTPVVEQARQAGLSVIEEAFADRAYHPDGTLVSRREPGAVHSDPDTAAAQAVAIAEGSPLRAVDGTPVRIAAQSICVHGDNEAALAVVRLIHERFAERGIEVG